MSKKQPENRGGKREGAGRKPIYELGDQKRTEIIKAVEAEMKLNSTTFGRELGKLICEPGGDKRTKLAAMKLYASDVLPKASEKDVNVNDIRKPQVFVPEKFPDSDEAPEYRASTKH